MQHTGQTPGELSRPRPPLVEVTDAGVPVTFRSDAVIGAPAKTPQEHQTLRVLLLAAKKAEAAATGPDRREVFRMTRSLLAAARTIGFTLRDLAELTGVSQDSLRSRSKVLAPIPRARFLALVPDASTPSARADAAACPGEDPVELLTWYLGTAPTNPRS